MLTRQQNIFLAKKTFTELVFNTVYIEGCNVTFPQTQTIIDGVVINGRLEKIMQRNLTER